jgi:hypothetical protein
MFAIVTMKFGLQTRRNRKIELESKMKEGESKMEESNYNLEHAETGKRYIASPSVRGLSEVRRLVNMHTKHSAPLLLATIQLDDSLGTDLLLVDSV